LASAARSIEAPIVLATVGQQYRFNVDPEAVINIKPQITLEPANATLSSRE
jgi:hypothetical protein